MHLDSSSRGRSTYTPALRRAPGIQTKVLGHVDQFVFSGLLPCANQHSEDFAIYVLSHMLGMSVFGRAFRPFLTTFVGAYCRRLCVCCHLPIQDRGHHSNSKVFCHDPTVSPVSHTGTWQPCSSCWWFTMVEFIKTHLKQIKGCLTNMTYMTFPFCGGNLGGCKLCYKVGPGSSYKWSSISRVRTPCIHLIRPFRCLITPLITGRGLPCS